MRFMGVKGDFDLYEDDNGNVHKLKKLSNEVPVEFKDFARSSRRKKLDDDFNDNFKKGSKYGNDKLLNGLKSKKTIKFNKKKMKKNSYNVSYKKLKNYF